ncbi:MAG: single-stranded DNA-binding protein [Bryobacteraceae bacterium]
MPRETSGARKGEPQCINNRVTLIGFVGKDAEVRNARNQAHFTVLSLASKRSWKDRQSGEYKSHTTWHRCIALGYVGVQRTAAEILKAILPEDAAANHLSN